MHRTGATARRLAPRWLAPAVVLGAATGLGLVVALERRDGALVRPCVVAVIAAEVVATLACGRGRQRRRSDEWLAGVARAVAAPHRHPRAEALGATLWVVLLLACAAWDGFSFSQQRGDFPTLSHLLGDLTAVGWGRGLVAAGWIGWGAWIALGWRRPRR